MSKRVQNLLKKLEDQRREYTDKMENVEYKRGTNLDKVSSHNLDKLLHSKIRAQQKHRVPSKKEISKNKYLFASVFGTPPSFLMFNPPKVNLGLFSHTPEVMKVSLAIISVMTIGSVLSLFSPLILKNSKSRNNFIVLFLMLFTGLSISLLAVNMFVENMLFVIFPLAVIMANSTQQQRRSWLSDLFLIVLLCLVLLNLGLNIENQISLY